MGHKRIRSSGAPDSVQQQGLDHRVTDTTEKTVGSAPEEGESSRVLLGWLWRNFLRKHLGFLLLALVFMIIEGSMLGALARMMQPMFDNVFVAGDTEAISWVGLVIMGVFVARARRRRRPGRRRARPPRGSAQDGSATTTRSRATRR